MLCYDKLQNELNVGDWVKFFQLFIEPEEEDIPEFGKIRNCYWDDLHESFILVINHIDGSSIIYRNVEFVEKVSYDDVVIWMLEV
jgi:hypothetical protein